MKQRRNRPSGISPSGKSKNKYFIARPIIQHQKSVRVGYVVEETISENQAV